MSVTFACDRCKEPVERKEFDQTAGELPDGLKIYGQFHLCNNCAGKLKSFITEPELWHKSEYE